MKKLHIQDCRQLLALQVLNVQQDRFIVNHLIFADELETFVGGLDCLHGFCTPNKLLLLFLQRRAFVVTVSGRAGREQLSRLVDYTENILKVDFLFF